MSLDLRRHMDEEYRKYLVEQSKRYMVHIRSLNHSIRMLRSEIDELREMASGVDGIDYTRDVVSTSANPDRIPNSVAKLVSMEAEYDEELSGYLDEQRQAHDALRNIEPLLARLLTSRYLEGKPWAEVAEIMGYDEGHVRKYLHEAALVSLHPYLPHPWRDPLHSAI